MIAKLARALPPNRYFEIRSIIEPDCTARLCAYLMEIGPEGDQGDRVVGRAIANNDASFESLTCHMLGIESPPTVAADELEAIAYVRDMIQANPLAGCQDAVSKRHTQMVNLFKLAAAKLLAGAGR